jgi:hypothetical protein
MMQAQTALRQDVYANASSALLEALDGLRRQVERHASLAARQGYHWGTIGDLTALLQHLEQLPLILPTLPEEDRP